jgi:hypothetical protein
MSDAPHANPGQGGRDQYKRHIDGNVRVSGQIEVHSPPDSGKEETPEQKKARSYRFYGFAVSVLTLLAVIIYAGLTAWQAYLTQRISKAAQRQLEFAKEQQRSSVQVSFDMSSITNEKFKTLEIPFEIENLGKLTASKIVIRTKIEVPLSSEEPSFDLDHPTMRMTHVPLYPTAKSPLSAMSTENGAVQKVPEYISKDLADGKRYVVLFGRIDYEDRLGHWWIQFCGWKPLLTHDVPAGTQAQAARCIDFNVDGGTPNKE